MDGTDATALHDPASGPVCWPPLDYASSDDYVSDAPKTPKTPPECPARRYCEHEPGDLPDYYLTSRGFCEDRRLWEWWRMIDQTFGWDVYRELFEQRGPASANREEW